MIPRFIVADSEVSNSMGMHAIIMLSDVGYWNEHYDELIDWCKLNESEIKGMTVDIPNDVTLTAFCLRWS